MMYNIFLSARMDRVSHHSPYKARYICILIVCLFFCQKSFSSDVNTSVSISFDKRGIPLLWDLWPDPKSFNIPYDGDSTANMAVLSLVCDSESDTTNGACFTQSEYDSNAYVYYNSVLPPDFGDSIKLKMTSALGDKKDITLNGYYGNGCSWVVNHKWTGCGGKNPLGFKLRATKDGIGLLSAGHWVGILKLYGVNNSNNRTATATINIIINVTDTGTQTIFFPSWPTSSPLVNLNLNTRPGVVPVTTVSGHNSIDMCLYDGSNSSSNRISLLFQDEGASAPGRSNGQFSVYRDGADKSSAANRIDYMVSVINPTTGAPQTVQNGKEIIWTNTNARNILRQVVLPGVPGTSLCVPAPLTLNTPAFTLATKNNGHYSGRLRIIYTPTTQTSN